MENMPKFEVCKWRGNDAAPRPHQRALVLPGMNYPIDQPGLFIPARALSEAGWQVWHVEWDLSDIADNERRLHSTVRAAAGALDDQTTGAALTLVVAKSIGSLAAEWVAEHAYPAVWLTPLLGERRLADAITSSTAPALLIGGTEDPSWDASVAEASGKQVRTLDGVDHGFLPRGDWQDYLDVVREVGRATVDFATSLT